MKENCLYLERPKDDLDEIKTSIKKSSPKKDLAKKRFWAKLADVNNMEIEAIRRDMIPVLDFSDVMGVVKGYRTYDVPIKNNTITVHVYTRDGHNYIKVYKVDIVVEFESKLTRYHVTKTTNLTLRSLTGAKLFETASYEALKKKTRETFAKKVADAKTHL